MRVLAVALVGLAVGAAPASAQIPVRGELGGGPAFAGDRVAWAEEGDRGAVRILTQPPRGL